jgi:peptidyl-dipeptidase A
VTDKSVMTATLVQRVTSILRRSVGNASSTAAIAAILFITGSAAQAKSETSAKAAKQSVEDAELKLTQSGEMEDRAGWVQATNITPDTDWLLQRASAANAALVATLAGEARGFDGVSVDPVTRRKLDMLKRLVSMPSADRPGAAAALSEVSNRLASSYASGKFNWRGRTYTLRDAEAAIAASRDPIETQALWEGWRSVAIPMRADYVQMVTLGNEGARERGYADIGAMWRSNYDMPPDEFEAEVKRLWSQLSPLYKELHCYARDRLNDKYGDKVQPRTGPIRADLTGNMWGQNWGTIYDVVGIKTREKESGLTQALLRKGYDAEKMVRSAEGFYVSLGLPALPDSFWKLSQFTRPAGREVDCNASAWSVGGPRDVRIKTCFKVGEPDWVTAHHELGHTYYQLAVGDQSFLFRGAADPGVSEGLGDFIALSTNTRADLEQLGLADGTASSDQDVATLLNVALAKLPLLAYSISVDEWRWGVFDGRIKPADYNNAWWKIVDANQGLRAPSPRSADFNDALAKYHMPNNVPYISYFMASVYQFQFYRAACRMSGWKGPLHQCTIRGNTEVGKRLEAMMSLGRSQPASRTIAEFTGEPRADASAMAEYFEPLRGWLKQQNRGARCGW